MLEYPRGERATWLLTGLNPHHRYRIFGDTRAVAVTTFQLVCSGSDNTELFSNHHLSVERDLLLEDHPKQALADLGASVFRWHESFLSKLVVSSGSHVAAVSMGPAGEEGES